MNTEIRVSPQQFVQTVAGNVALKTSFTIGFHAAHYGARPTETYLEIADATVALCRQHSAPFTGPPPFLSGVDLQLEALLAVSEVVSVIKARIRTDTEAYLAEAAMFWKNSQEFRDYRHVANRMREREIIDIILDSSDGEYVSRIDPQSLRITKERFAVADRDRYFKESGTKLVFETLQADSAIRSLINVGSRIDPTLYFAAHEFPDRKFLGFDFQHNLRSQNAIAFGSLPSNLFFASGYALDAFEAGLRADAVFFMATSVLFTVKEIATYFDLLARNGVRKIIISESWASPIEGYDCGVIVRPEEVCVTKPFLGGTVLNAQHNYIELLENAGYSVDRSVIIDDHFGGWYNILQITASLNPDKRKSTNMARLMASWLS